jgi:hypothetical protein
MVRKEEGIGAVELRRMAKAGSGKRGGGGRKRKVEKE